MSRVHYSPLYVVNGLAFSIAAALVPGFDVASFGSAVLGALIVTLVSWALGSLPVHRRATR